MDTHSCAYVCICASDLMRSVPINLVQIEIQKRTQDKKPLSTYVGYLILIGMDEIHAVCV